MTTGLIVGLDTGNIDLGLIAGAVGGIVIGLLFAALAMRQKRRAFHPAEVHPAAAAPAAPVQASPPAEKRAA